MLISIFLVVFGLVMLLKPDLFYLITESWKSDYSAEPSDLYVFSTRFGGIIFIIVGALNVVVSFLD